MLADKSQLVMVKRHVGFVEYFLFLNTIFPSDDRVLENVKLLLIPASVLRLVPL